ncbi:MAG: carboxypeptidase-like regulatory domain-containing protein, partial [Rhodothermales bacterium]|nr:carboxypeptidase-like regulatory domain-containing protein [Rhodothermales bacterium]
MHSALPSAHSLIRGCGLRMPMRRGCAALRRPFFGLLLAVLVCGGLMVPLAAAQEAAARHTLLLRGVPLADALRQLVVTTQLDLSFDPALVQDRRVYCVVEDEPVEVLLRCVLRGTGLDYFRLSSGLYVLTEAAAAPPQLGTLQGIVVDDETGEPLAFAHVLLADGQLGTVANETGRFVLADLLPGTYALTTSYLGYRHRIDSVYVPPLGMARARVPLRSEPVAVSPIVVDGLQSRFPSDSLGAEGLAAGRLARGSGGRAPDVARGLGTLVGVRLDHATADLHVQGGEAGEHQYHLDGAPVFVPVSVGGLVGPFSPFALGRVTVHKTGFGAAFGSQTAGLVQAEHALGPMAGRRLDLQADPLSLNARLGWRTGTPGAVEGSFLAAGRYGLWDLHAPGAVRHLLDDWNRTDPFMLAVFSGAASDAPTSPERPSFLRDFDGFTTGAPGIGFHDLHGAVRLRMGTLRSLFASTYHSRRTLESNRADDFFDLRADAAADFLDADAAPPARDFYTWSNSTSQVRYETVLGPRLLARVQARASRYRLAHDYGVHTIEESSLGQATFRYEHLDDNGNRIGEYALGATLDLAATDRWHVEAGAEPVHTASRFLVQGTLRLPISHQSSGWRVASFITNRIALTPTLSLDAGTRLTYVAALQRAYLEPR